MKGAIAFAIFCVAVGVSAVLLEPTPSYWALAITLTLLGAAYVGCEVAIQRINKRMGEAERAHATSTNES